MRDKFLKIRISDLEKEKLTKVAQAKQITVGDLVRLMIWELPEIK